MCFWPPSMCQASHTNATWPGEEASAPACCCRWPHPVLRESRPPDSQGPQHPVGGTCLYTWDTPLWFAPWEEENGGSGGEPQSSHRLSALLSWRVGRVHSPVRSVESQGFCSLWAPSASLLLSRPREDSGRTVPGIELAQDRAEAALPTAPGAFWNFTSLVAQYQAPPIPRHFSVVLEPGLVFTAGPVVGGGRVWLAFSMEMNSFSQARGWVGCALGAPAGWHRGPSSKRPTVEYICAWEIGGPVLSAEQMNLAYFNWGKVLPPAVTC